MQTTSPQEFHSVEAEQQLIGSILVNNKNYTRVADFLTPDHFYDPVHARIYDICGKRILKDHLCSAVTLKTQLDGDEGLKQLGGWQYLARMAGSAISTSMIVDYGNVILEMASKRQISEALRNGAESLATGEPSEVVTGLQQALGGVPVAKGAESSHSLLKSVIDAVSQANESYAGQSQLTKTGIRPLDNILKGLAPGDLMLLGGTTSMGKTATAIEIGKNVAENGLAGGVVFVSLEMEHEQIANRMISAKSGIPYTSIRDASSLSEKEFAKYISHAKPVGELPMRIVPKYIRDMPAIHAAVKRAQVEMGGPVKLIVVDYAQLVRGEGRGRYEQMTSVSIGLKTMASLIGCPVIALVQLSRDIGFRDDHRPHLSDIKETGQFENDADQVVFCNREQYWLETNGPKANKEGVVTVDARADWEADKAAANNKIELIVRKNRHGRKAICEVGVHMPTNKFWDLKEEQPEFGDDIAF